MRKYKLQLKTLSPLHIGGKEGAIPGSRYCHFENKVYFLKEKSYLKMFMNRGLNKSLYTINNNVKVNKNDIAYSLRKGSEVINRGKVEIRQFIRDVRYQPYVPGSSIKGALRNMLLNQLIATNSNILKTIEESVNGYIRSGQRNRKVSRKARVGRQNLENFIEGFVRSDFLSNKYERANDQNKDFFRTIRISDSKPLDKNKPVYYYAKIYRHTNLNSMSPKDTLIFLEAIPKGITLEFELTFDETLANMFCQKPFTSPEELVDMANAFAEMVKQLETEYFQRIPDAEKDDKFEERWENILENGNLVVGFGSGLLGSTLFPILSEKLRKDIRNLFDYHDDLPAPSSLRVIASNNKIIWPIGWCQISLEETEV